MNKNYQIKGMSFGGGKLFYELSVKVPGKVLPAFIGDFDTYEQAKLAAIEHEAEQAAYEAADRVYNSYDDGSIDCILESWKRT